MDITETSQQVQRIIDDAVEKAVAASTGNAKDQFGWLVHDIQSNLTDAQQLYDDMKSNGLTAGTIEAEGFLRCAIQLSATVDRILEAYPG